MRPKYPRIQPDTADPIRYQARILACGDDFLGTTPACEQELAGLLVGGRYSSTAWRVCSLNSNLTGCLVFFCRTVARSAVYPPAATSSTLIATTSQPRSLLSIARLNIARSRLRSAIWSLVRIDQTCLGRSGGLAPISLPLFQAARLGAASVSLSCMVILLVVRVTSMASTQALRIANRRPVSGEHPSPPGTTFGDGV